MKHLVILLLLIGFVGPVFAIGHGMFDSLTETELILIEQGYYVESYSIMPFGDKHFFFKADKNHGLSETSFGRCLMYATFVPRDSIPMQMTMKFPNDLIWPGMYDNSTFFSVKSESGAHAPPMEWEKIEPVRDSDFTTLEFDLKGEVNHIIINITTNHETPGAEPLDGCPQMIPKMEFDYYDRVNPISTQRLIAEHMGFPPDIYICENNLIGAIKATNDKTVCVKPETKIKLIERGWAKDFSENEN